jgi:hypothetical protein
MNERISIDSDSEQARGSAKIAALKLPVWLWLVIWMAVWVGGSIGLHYAVHGVVNGWHIALAVFLAINILICTWEMSLYFRIDDIERWHHQPRDVSGRPRGGLYSSRVTFGELFASKLWARVWLEYARYDPSYADRKSFGFAIDVGNGFSTIIPSLVFFVAMTVPLFSPLIVGLLGILIFYQKSYCTCLYFFTYIFNRRYELHPLSSVLVVVGGSNGIWLVFPAVGFYVCLHLILDGSFDLIWT